VYANARVLTAEIAVFNACHVFRQGHGIRALYLGIKGRLCWHAGTLEGIEAKEVSYRMQENIKRNVHFLAA
jgi:hypothetical protein